MTMPGSLSCQVLELGWGGGVPFVTEILVCDELLKYKIFVILSLGVLHTVITNISFMELLLGGTSHWEGT